MWSFTSSFCRCTLHVSYVNRGGDSHPEPKGWVVNLIVWEWRYRSTTEYMNAHGTKGGKVTRHSLVICCCPMQPQRMSIDSPTRTRHYAEGFCDNFQKPSLCIARLLDNQQSTEILLR